MKHTSKALLDLMRKEAEEDRPSIDELIQQMEYKLNKKIALLENTIRCQMLVLSMSDVFTPKHLWPYFATASFMAIAERKGLLQMPASPLFKKGGFHHKFTKDEASGEFIMKHPPKKNKAVYPEPIRLHLF
jgi:hypothetical protein